MGPSQFRTRLLVWSNTTTTSSSASTTTSTRVSSTASTVTEGQSRLVQTVRIQRPAVHLSGQYTCKVATFFKEEKTRHKVIIFGKSSLPPSLPGKFSFDLHRKKSGPLPCLSLFQVSELLRGYHAPIPKKKKNPQKDPKLGLVSHVSSPDFPRGKLS